MPLLGEAFFTSAINPGNPVLSLAALKAPIKSRTGGAFSRALLTVIRGFLSLS